eukprot:500708_1
MCMYNRNKMQMVICMYPQWKSPIRRLDGHERTNLAKIEIGSLIKECFPNFATANADLLQFNNGHWMKIKSKDYEIKKYEIKKYEIEEKELSVDIIDPYEHERLLTRKAKKQSQSKVGQEIRDILHIPSFAKNVEQNDNITKKEATKLSLDEFMISDKSSYIVTEKYGKIHIQTYFNLEFNHKYAETLSHDRNRRVKKISAFGSSVKWDEDVCLTRIYKKIDYVLVAANSSHVIICIPMEYYEHDDHGNKIIWEQDYLGAS